MARMLQVDDQVVLDAHIGVVERTYGNVESHSPDPRGTESDDITKEADVDSTAFQQFLVDGIPPKETVLVRWLHAPESQIIHEDKLQLLDRSFLIGDIVKRNEGDSMSGVVINTVTQCTLQSMSEVVYKDGQAVFKGFVPSIDLDESFSFSDPNSRSQKLLNVPASELELVASPADDDLVVYKNWLGRIEATHYRLTLKLADNCVVEIKDEDVNPVYDSSDQFALGDIGVTKKSTLRREGKYIYGQYNPNTPPVGTVVDIRLVVAEVDWLERRLGSKGTIAPPSVCERLELESPHFHVYDRTRRPAPGHRASGDLVSDSEIELQLGSRVRFKDLSGACVKYDGTGGQGKIERISRYDSLGYDMNVFDVLYYTTDVIVQWQDLSLTRVRSIDVVPDSAIDDDHAVWPGEIAHTLPLKRVHNMPGTLSPDKVGVIQKVNGAERMATIQWCPRAMLQYSSDPDGDASYRTLVSNVVHQAAGEVHELSLYDIEAPGEMNVRRGDIVLLASHEDWLGEIVDTSLDGTLTVRLGAAKEVRDIVVNREQCVVAVRSDDSDLPGNDPMGALNAGMDSFQDGLGGWDTDGSSDSDYTYDEESDKEARAIYEDENGDPMDEDDVEDPDWESDDEDDDTRMQEPGTETPPTSHPPTPEREGKGEQVPKPGIMGEPDESLPRYDILDTTIPDDHHYKDTDSSSEAVHMKRTQKEHRILRSPNNLPPGVFIRTWESRLDLLRVLLIGPEETPYYGAPFVIDFHLGTNFPTEPPRAFFHSWSGEGGLGGVGRVNPNLYEDGKICLSLLGTWDGAKRESWSAGKSTLLQLIVSLLGLVLVREPYFNEAGYETLAGLESSKRASALYNERTYLRSRAFIIRALAGLQPSDEIKLASGLAGLSEIVRWLYYHEAGGRLIKKAVEHTETILNKSEGSDGELDGVTFLSKGACIPLRRVLERLKQLC
ncbi:hypothetical protein K431DRAFT_287857 [Polychaeton citri CBS 116435]|uniref:UBC core domain-containing protein n=1 Tax=Polychaeton citri CBS 116435 TaxID=1314669 RepID=A0A9P4Q0B3_9PEZI|nr:hypothetical protein K431DRAFT_287857 [Polychaeton citri CBS 116435]